MFDTTYQILQLPGGQLQIADAPQYLMGGPLLLIAAVVFVFFVYRIYKSSSLFPLWGIVIFGLPLLFCGLMVLRTGSLTLDRSANTAQLHVPRFLWHTDTTIPMESIRHAEIRTMRSTSYIALVLTDGEAISFADSTQASGKGRAVDAINRYIGAPVR